MTAQHTPGPWQAEKFAVNAAVRKGFSGNWYCPVFTPGQLIATAWSIETRSEAEANAALIAAAPETAAERDRLRAVNSELVRVIELALGSGWLSIDSERDRTYEACNVRKAMGDAVDAAKAEQS